MKENIELIRSANHALALMTAGCLAAMFWLFFRLPHSNLMIVTGSFLLTGLLYDIASWENRLRVTLKALFSAGILQFLIGVCRYEKFLLLILPALFIFIMLSTIRSKATSSVALLIGCLGLSAPGGFYPAATRFLDMSFTAAAVMLATSLIGIVHYQNQYELELPGSYTKVQALRIALMFAAGTYIMEATHLPEGLWIVFTIAMVYCAINSRQDAFYLAKNRIFSTPLGLILCYFYMGCFTYFDYRMTYLIPVFCASGFFILYYTRNYFAFTTVFVMTFSIYVDIATGNGGVVHIWQLICSRSLASVIGVFLLMLFESYFLPDKEAGQDITPTTVRLSDGMERTVPQ